MPRKIIKSETVLKNNFFKITKDDYEKSDRKIVKGYFTIHRPKVVVICALTEKNKIVLIRQYRHPVRNFDVELPAGYTEPHEKDGTAAKRELLEETGYKGEKFKKIGEVYSSAGLMSNNINFFIGFNAKKIHKQTLDQNEEITEVKEFSWKEVLKMIQNQKIKDMASVTGILLAKDYIKKLK